jgi:acyl-CoA reductase-like NAD-dependent aldehyde dehydrogenase
MKYQMVIGGQLTDGVKQLDVVNPATGKVFVSCARGDERTVDQAVAAAKAAHPDWSRLPIERRRIYLRALADALEKRQHEFAALLTQEQGKPIAQAAYEIGGSIAALRAFAQMDLPLKTLRESATEKIVQQRTSLGVIAAITPWNFPVLLLMIKVGPALLAGNTVVAKPAPTTPLTTLLFGMMAVELLPAGVFNTLIDDNDLGAKLTTHPDVAKVAFTGSTATGRKVMQSVAGTIKRLTLELGGNDAALVLDDANPKEVAPKIFNAAMLNAGQVCLAAKRVYVPQSMYEEICMELAKLAKHAVVGDGSDQATQIGPIQNKRQFDKLEEFLADARASGKVIAGGTRREGGGYFVDPTIVRDIADDAKLVREEQFGPILPILKYTDIKDAITRVNDSEYGLGATIWTSNPAKAMEIALQIESGTVWINRHLDLPFDVPFGGAKQSGLGAEHGQDGLDEYTQAKIINMALS